jgi:hypothetical protein
MHTNEARLILPAITPEQILHDLKYLLKATAAKQDKRIKRFRLVARLLGEDPDAYLAQAALAPPQDGEGITRADLDAYFARKADEPCYEPVALRAKITPKELEIARALSAELTKQLNATDHVYNVSCGYVARLLKRLRKNPILGALFATGDMIFLLKGSMAQRRVLAAAYPAHAAEIEAVFGRGGDNDCNLLINPALPNFDKVHAMASDVIYTFLLEAAGRLSCGTVATAARAVREIEVAGVRLAVRPHVRQSFHISKGTADVSYLDFQVTRSAVYASRNDTLDFADELQNRACFGLNRLKYAMEVTHPNGGRRLAGAEIWDVANPLQPEYRLKIEYEQYSSGRWVAPLVI